jgi:phage baseplate assembly protein W
MFLYKNFLGGRETSEIDDVLRNLSYVLGTKRGTGYFLENFGTSDIGFRTPEEMVVALTSEIRENVRLWEPRVEVIDVDEDWDDAGRRTKLVVRMRLRGGKEGVHVVVDLAKRSFDVVAAPSSPARGP